MASSNVVINVKSNLLQVAEDLRKIAGASKSAMGSLEPFVKKSGNVISDTSNKTMQVLTKLQGLTSTIGKKMGDNFKAMFSAMGIAQGLKMGAIFGDSVKEAFQLSDQIRKLSSIFGIAENRFVGFQAKLVKGLGEIGLSSDSASNALKGLAETQVRGEDALVEYSKLAGQLASIGQQPGQEGTIAKGIADTITERGGNPSDTRQARSVAEDVRKTVSATGIKPTDILTGMKELFSSMSDDFKKSISTRGLMQLAVIQKTAGVNSTKFFTDYLGKSPIFRRSMEARGMGGLFTEQGLDTNKFRAAIKNIFKTIPEDMQLAAQTLGVDEDTARGMIQLYKSLDRVDDAQRKVQQDNKTLTDVYMQSMGALEAFTASLNKFKASLSEPIATATNWLTDMLKKGFGSSLSDFAKALLPKDLADKITAKEKDLPDVFGKNFGATVTTVGAAVGTSMLFGGGITGLASMLKGKAGGLVEKKAAEEILGQQASPVYVVNADEIAAKVGQAQGAGSAASALGYFGKLLAVGTAGAGGYAVGGMVNEQLQSADPNSILGNINTGINKLVEFFGNGVGLGKSEITVNVNGKAIPNAAVSTTTKQAGLPASTSKPVGKIMP